MASTKHNLFKEQYLTPVAVLLGAAFIGFAIMHGGGGAGPASEQTESPVANMEEIADSLGMDTDRLAALVSENRERYQATIDADRTEGESFGIMGTPGTIVGTQLIPGAYPLEVVLDAIEGRPITLPSNGAPPADVDIARVALDGNPSIGSASAPTTMAVWFDFQCPYCKRFEAEVLSEIVETRVRDGQVRIVYKDFQFLGPESNEAGLYSRAIWEAYPDRWHEWYREMLSQ